MTVDTEPAPGILAIVTGLPGSGKSTLAIHLAEQRSAVRMSPDDWMIASGIDLWDEVSRAMIESSQLDLTLSLLEAGRNVVIEWGTWTRAERDALRDAGRSAGSAVELHHTAAPIDELVRRIHQRDRERRWGSRAIERRDIEEWWEVFEPPTDSELATYDPP